MIEQNPFILGAVLGARIGDTRTVGRKEAKRYDRYLVECRCRWRDPRNRPEHTCSEIDLARRRVKHAIRDGDLLQQIAGTPQMLRETMLEKIKAHGHS